MTRLLAVLLALLALAGCSGGSEPESAPTSASSPTSTPSVVVPPPTPPAKGACYRLDYDAALADHSDAEPVRCSAEHTSTTYFVGDVPTPTAEAAATRCPERLSGFVRGQDLRLTMLRPIWFTPTPEERAADARWFRCDVVAVASDGRLAPLAAPIGDLERYAMCGTAEPGSPDFRRVICSRPHAWRAISVVPFSARDYPGEAAVRDAGQEPCEAAGAEAADNALDYRWGYEWPTRDQWDAGQRYGRCWAPA
ncbi:septum formation family protein [Nocardioides sp. SR21]|uniref:septum formation family protein n=1 Tax=Nocardioides sp. SR21 TaxID=2919501 RepID=UPI001FA9BFA1|nr:septum formation family protein [Nocardioides sp. SR21]